MLLLRIKEAGCARSSVASISSIHGGDDSYIGTHSRGSNDRNVMKVRFEKQGWTDKL